MHSREAVCWWELLLLGCVQKAGERPRWKVWFGTFKERRVRGSLGLPGIEEARHKASSRLWTWKVLGA